MGEKVLHKSGEDYLEAVLVLSKRGGGVRSVDLAEHIGYTKASVSRAVSLLKEGGFITVDSEGYLHLTEVGRETAEKIYERHSFFRDSLISAGVDPATADSEACRMEHAISEESFNKLKKHVSG